MMDVLLAGHGTDEDNAEMLATPSYDYKVQAWMDSSDHAHYDAGADGDLKFCGCDARTCLAGHKSDGTPIDGPGQQADPRWIAKLNRANAH